MAMYKFSSQSAQGSRHCTCSIKGLIHLLISTCQQLLRVRDYSGAEEKQGQSNPDMCMANCNYGKCREGETEARRRTDSVRK